jgi:hypothetical protein
MELKLMTPKKYIDEKDILSNYPKLQKPRLCSP